LATIEQLQADRAVIAAARLKFLSGEGVKEISRDGRRLVMNTASLADFDAALRAIDDQVALLEVGTIGRRRRRAISLSFG
jgi:hypothetical protein